MIQNYQDAVALCRAYGNPDLFISFTSNPKWPEIAKMLAYFPGHKSHDRPKIGTRVFKIKLIELLDDLIKNNVFGESQAVVYVIDFQKHGLPHAHILLWLEEHCKCMTPSQIDDIISAELPSSIHDPAGYQVVTEYMLHEPVRDDARYPNYRRRDNKVTAVKGYVQHSKKHASHMGLLNDDKEWSLAISEAIQWALAPQLKDTFVTSFLLSCDVRQTQKYTQEDNWKALFEDIVHKKRKLFKYHGLQLTDEQIRNYCLLEIQELLNRYGQSLADFQDLPRLDPCLLTNMDNQLIREALDFDIKKEKLSINSYILY
ncbi:ATP-dependent DNA helicase PIF1-like protein [Tanacetum coccineum]